MMDFTKMSPYLLVLTLSLLSYTPQTLANCDLCGTPAPVLPVPTVPVPRLPIPTVPVPGLPVPTVPLPKLPVPTVPVPGLPVPTVPVPGLPVPTVPVPNLPLPPLPVINPPSTTPCAPPKPKPKPKPQPRRKPTPTPCPPAAPTSCPIDTLKLGACIDILGNVVHIGDPAVSCCPLIAGIASVEAAACLCTTIKAKALGLDIFQKIAIELFVTCGKTPPPGYKCA